MPIRMMNCVLILTDRCGSKTMTINSFQINELTHLYSRVAKVKSSSILEKDRGGPQDLVNISLEGKKRQIQGQARTEVLDQIRKTK